jgi:hypothetical protein
MPTDASQRQAPRRSRTLGQHDFAFGGGEREQPAHPGDAIAGSACQVRSDGGGEVFTERARIAAAQITKGRADGPLDRWTLVGRAVHADSLDAESKPR